LGEGAVGSAFGVFCKESIPNAHYGILQWIAQEVG
jgi:hypothetical protein